MAVQTTLGLWPVKAGPVELQVSIDDDYSSWSLWQKKDGKCMPLGFWSRKLPEATKAYTPLEKQLACFSDSEKHCYRL